MSRLIYVLPVHDEADVLADNVARLVSYLSSRDAGAGAEVFLVENGSKDESRRIAKELETTDGAIAIRAFVEPKAGIGYAYQRGLEEALARFGPSTEHWAILSATDLPFGFTDLEAALEHLDRPDSRMLIGSKAHPASNANTGSLRRLMSFGYRGARRALLGMRVGDSQGSIFLRLDLAKALAPKIESRNFFYSTELCHLAERARERIIEIPVLLDQARRASTVRPLHDSMAMARQLWDLRRRGSRGL
jgi:dolichyl-phosphate beta-glucosyltransferase